jgi:hypothetical protein
MHRAVFLASLFAASTPEARSEEPVRCSETGWVSRSGTPVPDTSYRRAAGKFCAELLVVGDPTILKRWEQPSEVFEVHSIDAITTGSWLLAIVAFSNPQTSASGVPDLVLDMDVLRPDGSSLGRLSNAPAWSGPPFSVESANKLELTTKYLLFRPEPDDPLGEYRVDATLRDKRAGRSLSLIRTVLHRTPEP